MKKKNSFFLQYRGFVHVARLVRKVRGDDFTRAHSYIARDELCRVLAAECYELAQQFRQEQEEKLALQYMKLAARLLGLSLKPKKLTDLDKIKTALEELKAEKAQDPA